MKPVTSNHESTLWDMDPRLRRVLHEFRRKEGPVTNYEIPRTDDEGTLSRSITQCLLDAGCMNLEAALQLDAASSTLQSLTAGTGAALLSRLAEESRLCQQETQGKPLSNLHADSRPRHH